MTTDTEHFDANAKHWDENPRIVARAQHVADGIRARVPLHAGMTAFEYGCGTGLVSFHLRPHVGRITLADTSRGMLDVVRQKIQTGGITTMTTIQLDLQHDPMPDDRFDLIYASNALHHVPDVDTVLQKFSALLNPGGWLCIADLDLEDGAFHGKDFHGHHGFEREALRRQFTDLGLSNVSVSTCFTMQRQQDDGTTRDFTIFLMIGEKTR